MIRSIYLAGSLKNQIDIPQLANDIKALGIEPFCDWLSPGEHADQHWREYSQRRGLTYANALKSYAATHIYEFDRHHLDRCDAIALLMPAGKSAHMEFGYMIGARKPGFILFDEEPEKWDVMYQFATGIFFNRADLLAELKTFAEAS